MKILYAANEQNDARLAEAALHSIAEDVTVAWAGHLSEALLWISENQDLTAVVVETQVQNQSCTPFVGRVRGLGLTAPIVVVASEEGAPPLAALKAGADDYLVRNESLFRNLTATLERALERAQKRSPLRLLYVGDAALARECLDSTGCSITITEAVPGANRGFQAIPGDLSAAEKPLPFDVVLVEHDHPGVDTFGILKDVVARQLPVPVIVVVEWDEALAIPALKLGAADYVVKAKESFRALLFRLDRHHREDVHAVQAALRETEQRLSAADERVREGEARLQATIEHERINRDALEQKLAKGAQQALESSSRLAQLVQSRDILAEQLDQATQALERAQEDRAADAAEFEARSSQDLEERSTVASKLAAAEAALHDAERRHTSEMTAAVERVAERQRQHDTALAQFTAARDALEQKLVEAAAELDRTEQARKSEAASYAGELAQRGEAFTVSLTQIIRSRDALQQQLADASSALERALRDRAADADAAAERLTQRETELAEATETQQALERRLADAEGALREAIRRSEEERSAAAEQAARGRSELEAVLAEAGAKYRALEQNFTVTREKLAVMETAVEEAKERYAAALTMAAAQLREQQREYEARLAEATTARDVAERRSREAAATLESAREDHRADATAAAERLTRQEAQLAEASTTRRTLERRLADAETALENAEQRAAADRLAAEQQAAQRQAELAVRLDREVANRQALEQTLTSAQEKLAATEAAMRDADERHASNMSAAGAQFADRQAQYETRLSQATERLSQRDAELVEAIANRQVLEERLTVVNSALQAAEQQIAAERLATGQQATQRQAQFEADLAREVTGRHTLERDLAASKQEVVERDLALRAAEQRHATAVATATREFAERQRELEARLAQATVAHAALVRTLDEAKQRHSSEMAAAARQFAEGQREYETRLAQAAAAKGAVDRQIRETEATLEQVRHERAAEAAATADRLAQREAALAEAAARAALFERRLAEETIALQIAEQRAESERLAAVQHTADRQLEFDARLAREVVACHILEQTLTETRQRLTDTEAALRDVQELRTSELASAAAKLSEQERQYTTRLAQASTAQAALEDKLGAGERQHAAAMQAAATYLTERQREYETRLAQATADREVVAGQLREAEAALARARQESASNAAAAAGRLAQRESELAAAAATRQDLERRLVETETAFRNAEDRALAERAATATHAAELQTQFDAQMAQEVAARKTVEGDLASTRAAEQQARQAFLDESTGLTERMREVEARLTEQLARDRAVYEARLSEAAAQLRAANVERDSLRRSLAASQEELRSLSNAREEAKAVRADAAQTLERVRGEHAAELARVEQLVAERDGQMKEQAARHAASQRAAHEALARLDGELRAALEARRQQTEQLQNNLNALARESDAARTHRDTLQLEADRVPQLTRQLEMSRAENRRQFEQSPVAMLRCSRTGALQHANRALIAALGYRSVDDLRAVDLAASVFESADDLRWLIEHSQRTPTDSIDCIWKKRDGSRLVMRLRAVPLSADAIEIVAEDLTSLRAVEDRLRQAQRMEAVGRLASEVAVTCDNLLRNVSQDGQQWLATVGSNTAQRHQGEMIFGEVTRAAGFLRQLSVYGDKQTSALAPVDVHKVLRGLEAVLKRVAGDDIQLVLPKKAAALHVDVDAERVERVLVNVAAYGRSRMPSGGRLMFELARVTVDRDFVAKYPNVRQGAHALITITEVRAAAQQAGWPIGIREPIEAATGGATERPGVDLGTLQALIRDCGGHLWMKAEPGGNMEVKIHLPLRPVDTSRSAGLTHSGRGRSVARWFQS